MLYNLMAVLLGSWQHFVISDICLRSNFSRAVGVLVGVFEYHTLRTKKAATKLPEQTKLDAQRLRLPERLLEMEDYGE